MQARMVFRKLVGSRRFAAVGRYYRSMFMDLDKVVQFLSESIPANSQILDVGGGDGYMLNELLALRSDIGATLMDLREDVGASISPSFRPRVTLLGATTIRQVAQTCQAGQFNTIIVIDVAHHIPPRNRREFFEDLSVLAQSAGATVLIKDVEPGYVLSKLGYLSDRYVSGDKGVKPISRSELCQLLLDTFGEVIIAETPLFLQDRPNYLVAVMSCSTSCAG